MSILAQIQKGKTDTPPRFVVYGTEGIGKSTLGSQLPAPIFIQTEDGLSQIAADKFPQAQSYESVIEQLDALLNEEHEYQSVVVDSLDRLELLIFDSILRDQNQRPFGQMIGCSPGVHQVFTKCSPSVH